MSASVYQRNAQTDTSIVGDRIVVFERVSKSAIVLNPTGAQIWRELETPRSLAQLNASLKAQFADISAAQIEADVAKYLGELQKQNLVESA